MNTNKKHPGVGGGVTIYFTNPRRSLLRFSCLGECSEPHRSGAGLQRRRERPRVPRRGALAGRRCLSPLRRCRKVLPIESKVRVEAARSQRRLEVRRMPKAIHSHSRDDLRGQPCPAPQMADGDSPALRRQERNQCPAAAPNAGCHVQERMVHGSQNPLRESRSILESAVCIGI